MENQSSKMETWLVTGGAGFLGIHMCHYLVNLGHKVISYDIETIPKNELRPGIREIVGDICDFNKLKEALKDVDYVVHSAAALALARPELIAAVNGEATQTIISACKATSVKRMLYVSTTAVYGTPKTHPIYETNSLDPMGTYGIAKAKAERYCLEERELETVIIRPKSFIGTGRLGIFQVLFDWIEYGKNIYIFGDGENQFQLLSVNDLTEAIYLGMLRGKSGEIYNVGAKVFGTVNADVGALLKHANTGSRMVHIPAKPAKMVLRVLEVLKLSPIYKWVYDTADKDSFVSIEKAQKELLWEPKSSNAKALIDTYDWYLKEGKILAQKTGTSHRVAWKQGVLRLIKAIS